MSNIGRLPIKVPSDIKLDFINNNTVISTTGPYGSLTTNPINGIYYEYLEDSQQIKVKLVNPKLKKNWGLARTLLANNIKGVSRGFQLTLNLVGVGYKAQLGQSVNGQPVPVIEAEYKAKYGDTYKDHLNKMMENQPTVQNLTLKLGFSHDIFLDIPQGITVKCPNNSTILLTGTEKDLLSQFAAKIRSYRLPEPYKGKGILFKGETVRRKQGKN
jgi:large subunit ribosomal protein L6